MAKFDINAISSGLALINVAMPGVVSLIATFSNGQQIDIQKLLNDTDAKLAKIIAEGEDFLSQTPEPETPEPPVPATPSVDVTEEPEPPA